MYAFTAKLAFALLLTSKLFGFNFIYVVICFRPFALTFYRYFTII